MSSVALKNRSLVLLLSTVACLLAPVGPARGQPAAAPAPTGPATPETAVCAVCGVREKAGPEPVAATFIYQGKTYYFCKQACKEEFRLDPEKWIKAAESGAAVPRKPAANSSAAAVPT
jgi:YHS domain-containing protein